MAENQNKKPKYDLEERTLIFAERVNEYIRKLPKDIPNIENGKQSVKSAGSVGANYIEANKSLSKKDFIMRVKICRKEAKESRFWLKLTQPNEDQSSEKELLIQEAKEFTHIFGSMITKVS
jgi:four helix bundle protein